MRRRQVGECRYVLSVYTLSNYVELQLQQSIGYNKVKIRIQLFLLTMTNDRIKTGRYAYKSTYWFFDKIPQLVGGLKKVCVVEVYSILNLFFISF
jgi:hypothetical protein